MEYLWEVIGFLLGLSFINNGIDVIDTGIVLNSIDTKGFIIYAGKYSNYYGMFFFVIGMGLISQSVHSALRKRK